MGNIERLERFSVLFDYVNMFLLLSYLPWISSHPLLTYQERFYLRQKCYLKTVLVHLHVVVSSLARIE